MLPIGNSVAGPLIPPPGCTPGYGARERLEHGGHGHLSARRTSRPRGFHKNLGYLPTGYDGIDNDGDGLGRRLAGGGQRGGSRALMVLGNLQRPPSTTPPPQRRSMPSWSEAWGPLGSVFSPDDFSDREVKDTDGDGLPEFVDAWGQPLPVLPLAALVPHRHPAGAGDTTTGTTRRARYLFRRPSSSSTRRIARSSRTASRTRWTPTSSSWRRLGGRLRPGRRPRTRGRHSQQTAHQPPH